MPLSNDVAVLSPTSHWIDSPVLMHVLVVATSWSRLAVEGDDWYGGQRIAWFPYQDD